MRSGEWGTAAATPTQQGGFILMWMLIAVALLGFGLATLGTSWAMDARRERERDLVRVGGQYAQAVASYYYASPIAKRELPRRLEDLVEDTRGGAMRRHLRQLYADPISPDTPWGLVQKGDGGIVGVYSRSTERPLQTGPVEERGVQLPGAAQYQEWKFVAKVAP